MSEAFKICPICDTANLPNAAACMTCGATLLHVEQVSTRPRNTIGTEGYDYRYGETDLYENSLQKTARRYLLGIVAGLIMMMIGGLALMFAPQLLKLTEEVSQNVSSLLIFTNTPRPTLAIPTVTEGPPTLTPSPTLPPTETSTPTPTREPCQQTVQDQDGLIAIVSRCGHRDLFVITQVMNDNNLSSANDIRAGQVLSVPWPTETPDPNAPTEDIAATQVALAMNSAPQSNDVNTANTSSEESALEAEISQNLTMIANPALFEEVLPDGVMFHYVEPQENAIIISERYNTNVEVLYQLNPEITFAQCDFGQRFGGPRCVIPLSQGQKVRVPAPTPTPTLSPTPSGSETATPTPTATFNAPNNISPSNRAYFRKDEVVTLRWISTGYLDDGQAYRVTVDRINDQQQFTADTTDLFFVIPPAWQGDTPERYEYQWTISLIDLNNPSQLNYTTQALSFTWEGRGESS